MEYLNSINDLFKIIIDDKQTKKVSYNRYPIRFIFLPNLDYLKELITNFQQNGIELINLSDYLPKDDSWFTIDMFLDIIKNLSQSKDYIILPFSEVLRFFENKNFFSIVKTLTEIENTVNYEHRLYFPMIGVYERFEKLFIDNNYRLQNMEWAPIWKLQGDINKIKIFFFDFDTKLPTEYKLINSSKEWLNFWKSEIPNEIYIFSKVLSKLYKNTLPDQIFEVDYMKDPKDFIHKYFNIHIPIKYLNDDIKYWNELIDLIFKYKPVNFEDLVLKIFNRQIIEKEDIIDLIILNDDIFYKWLIKHYVIDKFENSYLFKVFEQLIEFDINEIANKIWIKIFECSSNIKNMAIERKNYLKKLDKVNYSKSNIENKIEPLLNSIISDHELLLTDITVFERKYIIDNVFKKDNIFKNLELIYPNLEFYLSNKNLEFSKDNLNWLNEYFMEYKLSKIKNQKSEKLNELINIHNANKKNFYDWYYKFDHYKSIIGNNDIEKVLWIDGLGVEWLSYISHLVENNNYKLEKVNIARVNIPTITKCNDFNFIDNLISIKDLDEFIHSKNNYEYPEDIVKQLEIIDKIFQEHVFTGEKIMIVSDHGFTTFATSEFGNKKTYDFSESHHEGRALWTDKTFADDSDFIFIDAQNLENNKNKNSIVALKHTSLFNVPRRESHGGVTPEEILVPILIISKLKQESYNISPCEVAIDVIKPQISFNILPNPQSKPCLKYKDKTIELINQDGKWLANFKNLAPKKYFFILKIGAFEKEIIITIKGGMKERDLI